MADGHDAPGLVAQAVPSLAAKSDDLVVGFEDAVRQPVVAHELPEVFERAQFRTARRQRQDGDVVGQIELCGGVPTGLIHDEDGVGVGFDGGTDLGQMSVHRVGVTPGQHEADVCLDARSRCSANAYAANGQLYYIPAGSALTRLTSGDN